MTSSVPNVPVRNNKKELENMAIVMAHLPIAPAQQVLFNGGDEGQWVNLDQAPLPRLEA